MSPRIPLAVFTIILAMAPKGLLAGGNIYGVARMEKIKGQPQQGYIELYEWSLFLTPANSATDGISRRIGCSQWMGSSCLDNSTNHGGNYCKSNLPAGIYSGLLNQPRLFATPKVLNNLIIANNQTTRVDFDVPIDYSTYAKDEWTDPGPTWYQTFIATGYGIRGVSFCHANPNTPEGVTVTILSEKKGEPDPAFWIPIASATRLNTKKESDNWVRWRTGEVPTYPGQRYAVKLTGNNGALQPFFRFKDSNSYTGGRAYFEGWPLQLDLNVTVFSDNDGTSVTMNSMDKEYGLEPDDSMAREAYGQTFVAKGKALAAVDVVTRYDTGWDSVVEWRVREGGPTGPQVGASRKVMGAWDGNCIHGVSFNPGEIPLTAGQIYFIEMRRPYGGLVNPFYLNNEQYNEGRAYRLNGDYWSALQSTDLHMTIVEYMPGPSSLRLDPTALSHVVDKGSNPLPDTVTITNTGTATVCYTASEAAPWLSVAPVSGCLAPGASQAMTLTYAVSALPNGQYQGTITVQDPDTIPQSVIVSVDVVTAPGDFDEDHDVDQDDFGLLQACLTGAGVIQDAPDCQPARLDSDDDVDQDDLAIFQSCFSGPNRRPTQNCAEGF